MITNMHLLRTILLILLATDSFSQLHSFNKTDSNKIEIRIDSLLYNVALKKYESLIIENYNEKKHEVIKIELDESELSQSPPILLESNLIFLTNNGLCYAIDINTKERNGTLEHKLSSYKLDRIIYRDKKICGCQLNEGKFLNGRFNTIADNRFYSLDKNHQWQIDTSLYIHMFNLFGNNNLEYNDEYLYVYSSYSHYHANTDVTIANKTKFSFDPRINSIVKHRGNYFALTNREFMTDGPSIYQLVESEKDYFQFLERYKIYKTSFITSFNINNSAVYLCRKDNINFLCEFKLGQFFFYSSFPNDDELGHYTYKIINQSNNKVLLTKFFKGREPKTESPYYIVDENKIITITIE
jgi:hypothetical protein